MGRLFDAVSSLLGVSQTASYEGQAAIELEAACDRGEADRYPIDLLEQAEMLVLDPRETLRALLADIDAGTAVGVVSSRFHAALAEGTVRACAAAADAACTDLVVLSGGVFQNRRLLEAVADGLAVRKLRVLVPALLPANDGGIAYGQAAVAARRLAAR